MKNLILDASQIVVAILLTTSLVVVNAAPIKQKSTETKPVHVVATIKKIVPAPPQPAPAPVPAPEPPQPPPVPPAPPTPPPVAPQPVYSGSHESWMAQAGIASSDFAAVDFIVSHESSWNPDATEPTSGAHGLVQALPYSKTGCAWDDPICQLQWGTGYAASRYGGWWAAQAFWSANRYW